VAGFLNNDPIVWLDAATPPLSMPSPAQTTALVNWTIFCWLHSVKGALSTKTTFPSNKKYLNLSYTLIIFKRRFYGQGALKKIPKFGELLQHLLSVCHRPLRQQLLRISNFLLAAQCIWCIHQQKLHFQIIKNT
jgi:hypothetical protein